MTYDSTADAVTNWSRNVASASLGVAGRIGDSDAQNSPGHGTPRNSSNQTNNLLVDDVQSLNRLTGC
ncbi:hypothetical protein ACVIW2_003159 [Bradyrhizobium huanghuaihaiense]|uniref:Uncharacterized protein n=1 Tax=Bradyrhizobium huanghuaihaiense TaxID=990078 RepID=A0A562RZP3_9BRAD|nr:hypothetical protein IQ16_00898 [Bradyrhizobium huanghuaihaiense]